MSTETQFASGEAIDRPTDEEPRTLPLDAWHRAQGGRMVPFAGYSMPIQYDGIIAEHQWTREHAGLFDVSHMGQLTVTGQGATAALEALLPADLQALKPGRIRYSLLLTEDGGIIDDLMVTNVSQSGEETFALVVNGATKEGDIAHLREHLPDEITLTYHDERALLALQGPEAVAVLDRLLPGIAEELSFMQATAREWQGASIGIGRGGYTGEDGFEISLPAEAAAPFADALLADERVRPVGLGARDSLRLEAGLPLYGHDIDLGTDPLSAGLAFAISKRRRAEGGYPGAPRIARLLEDGAPTIRVGLAIAAGPPAREGAPVLAGDTPIGSVTSGGFSPSLERAIAMATIDALHANPGTELAIEVRGRRLAATIVPLPFVPHRYHRRGAA